MDRAKLMEVLDNSTCLISKGERTRQSLAKISTLLWGILRPERSVTDPKGSLDIVDCQFVYVGINRERALHDKFKFLRLLDQYPDQRQLQDGPSYKHVSRIVGSDVTALRFFGLGHTLRLWDVLLPDDLDIEPHLQDEAADLGAVVITGYKRAATTQTRLRIASG